MKSRTIIYLTILLQISCYQTDHNVVNLNNNKIEALGHAGMGISNSYPINTFESITYALALGADGTEIDVQLSKDGVLVAYHDLLLQSSTNGSGTIKESNWKDIEDLYYDITPYHDYKIVSLQNIFKHTENLSQYRFALDCKTYTGEYVAERDSAFFQQYAHGLVQLLEQYDLPANTVIEAVDLQLFKFIRKYSDDYLLFLPTNDLLANIEVAETQKLNGFVARFDQVSIDDIAKVHDRGLQVILYNTQSKKDNIEAIEKNPDMIQSDRLKHLINALK
ncbi:MAG: glycerophosphodiester phosphodiesterase [Saprospiraceae bacterium]